MEITNTEWVSNNVATVTYEDDSTEQIIVDETIYNIEVMQSELANYYVANENFVNLYNQITDLQTVLNVVLETPNRPDDLL